jgi:hypothetical protein
MITLGASLWDDELRARVESLQWATALSVLRTGGAAIIEWGTWGRDERERLQAGQRPNWAECRAFDAVL